MNIIRITASVLFLTFMVSCDYVYEYTYKVQNDSDSEVIVELETYRIDSVFKIGINEKIILFITAHGVEGPDGPYFRDVAYDMDSIAIMNSDSVYSKRDYLMNTSWEYNQGIYEAIVSNNEFE